MTTAADDFAVEDAFEALLAGRPVSEEAAGLVAFTAAVRATATSPGRPNAALAELLTTGLLTDQSSPSIRTARSAGTLPSRESRVRRRRRFTMFFPALIAKFLSAGAIAQAATGAGVVLVAFTGAGAAGVLPNPVQDTFTSIVGSETSEETPPVDETPVDETPVDETPVDEIPVVEAPVDEEIPADEAPELTAEEEWALNGPDTAAGQSFSEWVREGNGQGWDHGSAVSYWAQHKNDKNGDDTEDSTEVEDGVDDGTGTEVEDGTEDGAETQTSSEDGGRSSRGNGHGNGNGHN